MNWSKQFNILSCLDSNSYQLAHSAYDLLLAVADDTGTHFVHSPEELQAAHDNDPDWFFGHISYDYKNRLESKLTTSHQAQISFPDLLFFRPRTVCYIPAGTMHLVIETTGNANEIFDEIVTTAAGMGEELPAVTFSKLQDRATYLDTIAALRRHIKDGDCYEINYCTGGYSTATTIDPYAAFAALNHLSPAPFAALYRLEQLWAICGSPERYIRKAGSTVVSQPMKGTARRGTSAAEDDEQKTALLHNLKERAENVMIVDLVRNDLARCCEPGSIKVDELFGIQTFPTVHQMVSTVSGKLVNARRFTDALACSFPMGSMTGAPKHMVMQLIDRYETVARGLFSGSIGYVTPAGDMDFNVMIRSLYYDAGQKLLTYQSGGAITFDSVAEQEWEEVLLKSWAMERIFSPNNRPA